MVQETSEQGKLSTWGQVQARIGEYAFPYEGFDKPEVATRSMALRMMYFTIAVHSSPSYGIIPVRLRRKAIEGNYEDIVKTSQSVYERWAMSQYQELPDSLLDFMIPFARKMRELGSGKLFFLKEGLRRQRLPLLLAERRLMRRQAWEKQLADIETKLKSPTSMVSEGKHRRILRDHERLAQLIQTS